MSYKFESMLQILNKLNSRERLTRDSLARHLGVTIRTADRYISTLRAAGFPISHDQQKGCYVFDQGYSLAKLDFSAEEVLALGLAKQLVSRFGARTRKALDRIEHKMSFCSFDLPPHIRFSGQDMPPQVEEHFRKLNYAIANRNQVEMDYHSAYRGGARSHRVVEPYFLYYQQGVWYLRAYCRSTREAKLFALDRMENVTVLDKSFVPRTDITAENLDGAFVDGTPVNVVARFGPKCKPYLERYKDLVKKPLPDGRVEIRFRTNGTKGAKLWLYRFLPDVEIVKPKELKEEIRKELREAAETV